MAKEMYAMSRLSWRLELTSSASGCSSDDVAPSDIAVEKVNQVFDALDAECFACRTWLVPNASSKR